jgi:hypothetical protein
MTVVQIGDITTGKKSLPYMTPTLVQQKPKSPLCHAAYCFKNVNAAGFGDYFNGLNLITAKRKLGI